MRDRVSRRTVVARLAGAVGGVSWVTAALGGRAAPAAAQIVDPNWSPPRTVYIPETGHTVDRLFLDLWRYSGGY